MITSYSQYFIPTLKEVPIGTEAASHQLLLRAGMVNMLTSGVYSYLPLGMKVLNRLENIIRQEMNATGAIEVFLPVLQPLDLWKKTGRDQTLADVMIRYEDKKGRAMCLGPTHEEVITDLVRQYVQSYRKLPLVLYQIQTKFRDEMRPRFGIVRACEFIMKDAYSFDCDQGGLKKNYQKMYEAYTKIFSRCDLKTVIVEADSGAMGGDVSHEYMVAAPIGEDSILICEGCGYQDGCVARQNENNPCPHCKKSFLKKIPAIELGHIFQLGTKYSQALDACFLDEVGQRREMMMGCYGIGVSRMISAIVETHYDENGIIWPQEVAPFDVEVLVLGNTDELRATSQQIAENLSRQGLDILIDDRDGSAGKKFKDADLIGIPIRVIVGKRYAKEKKVELKKRASEDVQTISMEEVRAQIEKIRQG